MYVKKIVGKLHLVLGFASGLIVLFLSITGCMLAFQKEIELITAPYQFVEPQSKPVLPPAQLGKIALKSLPDKKLHSVIYLDDRHSAQVTFFSAEPAHYYIVYINPYSGSVLKVKNMEKDFFRIIIMGHYYLWLPPQIGQPIVASATLMFLIMLITGIILWWPKNKAARKQRFTIKWTAKWRRVNYDMHNVPGFYITFIAIFIAITGLVMGFQWFANSIYWASSGGKTMLPYSDPLSVKTVNAVNINEPAINKIWRTVSAENPTTELIEIHFPESDSSSIISVTNSDASTLWKSDYRYFDQYTLKEKEVNHLYGRFETASVADKLMRMNYDVHIGAIIGLPGKILVFCASLVCGSLPITGFYIWLGRRKKKKSKAAEGIRLLRMRKLSYLAKQ
ncbi:PepSY-associated TM helix domain-containing protein [Rubrolithibacter danxiaensis]|uniref:PepSY-associated TM helix domain-containing protein n=1 Tax=Rubrolithibacter danxiaensis TaxID=3390805 RepID=UPI003BF83576